jgi:hypothetical protein
MNKTCSNCGYLSTDRRCNHYTGPRSMQKVNLSETCSDYATEIEVSIKHVCCTSADCARYTIEKISLDALKACLAKETRATVKKMIASRIKKLEALNL